MESERVTALACREPAYEPLPLWSSVAIPALAGWLGWGIRGQMGHETGAMVPGGMIGLSLALTADDPEMWRRSGLLGAAGAMGVSFGGTETMGQTVGLTMYEDTRDRTYWWGMLGLAIKGATWFGFCGAYLGMAASDQDYSPVEMLALTAASTGLWHLGVEVFNKPFDPPEVLPAIYFSDKYHMTSDNHLRRPRPEIWGGHVLALLGLMAYLAARRDRTALIMGTTGILAGALGWTGAQAVQAELRKNKLPAGFYRHVDIWKVMETGFGLIAGGILGLGMRLARGGRRLPPRRRASWWEKLLGLGAGAYAVGAHVMDKPWTDQGMDRMVVAGTALAAAFSSDRAAWLETLPLLHHYMIQNAVRYFQGEADVKNLGVCLDMIGLMATRGLKGLAFLMERAEKVTGRPDAAATGLVTMAAAHTGITNIKMLVNRDNLGLDDDTYQPLPVRQLGEKVIRRSWETQRAQVVTEGAFVVAAAVLTGLAIWALGKRR